MEQEEVRRGKRLNSIKLELNFIKLIKKSESGLVELIL